MKQGVFQGSVQIVQQQIVQKLNYDIDIHTPILKPKKKATQIKSKNQIKKKSPSVQKKKNNIFRFIRKQEIIEQQQKITLADYCKKIKHNLIYKKFDNNQINKINKLISYYSSIFINVQALKLGGSKILSFQELLKVVNIQINDNTTNIINKKFDDQNNFSNPISSNVKFDSNFQSGNLFAAFKIDKLQYDLVLSNDTNSKGNLQWFYFCVQVDQSIEIKFNIINMLKYDSLFNYGMYPAIFSERNFTKTGQQWFRGGKKILYQRNDLKVEFSNRNYYTFSFTYEFKGKDKVYFAYSYPYTYTRLSELITSIIQNPIKSKFCKRKILGASVMNIGIQCLTFSHEIPLQIDTRKVIIIFARQHPGETVGSWIAEGIIEQLLKKTKETEWLKKNFIIKILPMINPDGVILGNYRTNLSGHDLNRRWDSDRKDWFPQISSVKNLIKQLHRQKKIKMIIDLHGHSKKLQSFYYGNYHDRPEVPRSFPYLASKLSNDVNFSQCIFKNTSSKRNTARIYLSSLLQSPYVYTYQTSFYGGMNKYNKKYPYTIQDYKRLGTQLLNTIYQFYSQQNQTFKKAYFQLCQNLQLLKIGIRDSDSESHPEQFELGENQMEQIIYKSRKTYLYKQDQQYKKLASISLQRSKQTIKKHINIEFQLVNSNKNIKGFSFSKSIKGQYPYVNSGPRHQIKYKKRIMVDKQCQTQQIYVIQLKQSEQKKMRLIRSQNGKILFSIQLKKQNFNSTGHTFHPNIRHQSQYIKTYSKLNTIKVRNNQKGCQTNLRKLDINLQKNINSKNLRSKLQPLQ